MGHERVRWWVALLLPGLVLRSLIPLGFMPMFGPGYDVRFVVCQNYAPVPGATSSMSVDMPVDMPMDAAGAPDHLHKKDAHPHSGTPAHQDHGSCPYGSGPALGGLPALAIVLVAVQPAAEPAVASPQVAYFKVSPRAQSSRGPPA
jgi:hypothetical protein